MIELGYVTYALEERSGDRVEVVPRPGGSLVCAIDGLGHGDAAADAAERAGATVEAVAGAPLEEILRRCHEALSRTRGAVMTLVDFDFAGPSLTWVGVGNVEARLVPAGASPAMRRVPAATLFGGVLGHNLPAVRPSSHALGAGDLVVMTTDGIRGDFAEGLVPTGSPRAIAERVLEQSSRGDDDALVVVVRWIGDAE